MALWLVAWLVYAAYFQGQWIYGERPIYRITGDEPHYLVVAISLLRDGDLDVLNNYRDKHYLPFYPHHLGDPRDPEDMHAVYGRGGRLYSKHPLGLPLLLLPSLRLGGHGPATVFLMALTAVLSVQVFLLARDVTGRTGVALATWAAVSFTPPLLLYADQFYPEVPGALLGILGVRAAIAARFGSRQALPVGLAAGLLLWFHFRYAPIAGILMLFALARVLTAGWLRRTATPGVATERADASLAHTGWWLLVPFGSATAVLLALNWWLLGGVPGVAEYGTISLPNVLTGAPGLFLDQQYGLLIYAPVYIVALLGLPLLVRSSGGPRFWVIPAALGAYFVAIASFSYWFGAFSPPGRMLVPVVPLLAAPFALALARWRSAAVRTLAMALLVLSWGIARLLLEVPRLRYNQWDGRSQMLAHLSGTWGIDLVNIFPSYVVPAARSYVWALAALAALLAIYLLLERRPGRGLAATRDTGRSRGTPIAGTALLVLAVTLDVAATATLVQLMGVTNDLFPRWYGTRAWLLDGASPYAPAVDDGIRAAMGAVPGEDRGAFVFGFVYPAYVALLLAPLALLPFPLAATIWLLLAQVAILGGAWCCWQALGVARDRGAALGLPALMVALLLPASLMNLIFGQFAALVFAALAGAWYFYRRRCFAVAGVCLALALVKPSLALVPTAAALAHAAISRWAARRYSIPVAAPDGGGERQFIGWWLVATASLIGASLWLLPGWPAAFLRSTGEYARVASATSAAGLLASIVERSVEGPALRLSSPAHAAIALAVVYLVSARWWRSRRQFGDALAAGVLLGSWLVPPLYEWNSVLLLVPLLAAIAPGLAGQASGADESRSACPERSEGTKRLPRAQRGDEGGLSFVLRRHHRLHLAARHTGRAALFLALGGAYALSAAAIWRWPSESRLIWPALVLCIWAGVPVARHLGTRIRTLRAGLSPASATST